MQEPGAGHYPRRDATKRLMDTFSSAASIAILRCSSGGMRTWNFPEYLRHAKGAGDVSPVASISATTSVASPRIPTSASSRLPAIQESEGSSATVPIYPPSSWDHTTRYAYFPASLTSHHLLHSVDGLENLTHLIRFCSAAIILNVDTRITFPRHPIHAMRRSLLSRFAKISVTHPCKTGKSHIPRIFPHRLNQAIYFIHNSIITDTILQEMEAIIIEKRPLRLPRRLGPKRALARATSDFSLRLEY